MPELSIWGSNLWGTTVLVFQLPFSIGNPKGRVIVRGRNFGKQFPFWGPRDLETLPVPEFVPGPAANGFANPFPFRRGRPVGKVQGTGKQRRDFSPRDARGPNLGRCPQEGDIFETKAPVGEPRGAQPTGSQDRSRELPAPGPFSKGWPEIGPQGLVPVTGRNCRTNPNGNSKIGHLARPFKPPELCSTGGWTGSGPPLWKGCP